jgi:hypothetical protein
MQPDITCKRCGTVTTWNPFCPTCGAYLEFAGDPPWVPDEEGDSSTSNGPGSAAAGQTSIEPAYGVLLTLDQQDTTAAVSSQQHVTVPAVPIGHPQAELPGQSINEQRVTHAMAVEGHTSPTGPTQPCPACQHPNAEWRAYCEHCGVALPGAVLAPYRYQSAHSKKPGQRKTGPERHEWLRWSAAICALLLLAFLFWLFLFGPLATQTRNTITLASQTIWEFIDPTTGVTAPIRDITATSSLPGTSPLILGDGNSRTFWASNADSSFGAGTEITLNFNTPVRIDRLLVYPGIQNGQLDVRALYTPKQISIDLGSGPIQTRQLKQIQDVGDYAQLVEFPQTETSSVVVTIEDVYPPRVATEGSTLGSVAISELDFLQVPSLNNTVLNPLVPQSVPSGLPSSVPTAVPSGLPTTGTSTPSPTSTATSPAPTTP